MFIYRPHRTSFLILIYSSEGWIISCLMKTIRRENNDITRRNGAVSGLGIWNTRSSSSPATGWQLCDIEQVILLLWALVSTNIK